MLKRLSELFGFELETLQSPQLSGGELSFGELGGDCVSSSMPALSTEAAETYGKAGPFLFLFCKLTLFLPF